MIAARSWIAIGIAAVAAAAAPGRARAGECSHGGGGGSSGGSSSGGSSSGGGSSSSGSSSSWSDDASTGSAGSAGCVEASDVHGRATCRHFGDGWATPPQLPPLALELGTFVRRLGPSLGPAGSAGTMSHELGSYDYRVVDPSGPDADTTAYATGMSMRLTTATPYRVYVGLEGEVGGVVADRGYAIEMTGGEGERPRVTSNQVLYLGGGGVVGVRGRLGSRLMLGAEVGGGARTVQTDVTSALGACEIVDHHYATEPYVEPRVRADFWVSPWVAFGVFAGTDLIGGGSQIAGASLSLHLRAFDRGW